MPTHLLFDEADDASDEIEDVVVDEVLFRGVKEVLLARGGQIVDGAEHEQSGNFDVLVREGKIECVGRCLNLAGDGAQTINLKGGSLLPPLTGFGPALGLTEMISVSLSLGFPTPMLTADALLWPAGEVYYRWSSSSCLDVQIIDAPLSSHRTIPSMIRSIPASYRRLSSCGVSVLRSRRWTD